jgi:hypothetical protein
MPRFGDRFRSGLSLRVFGAVLLASTAVQGASAQQDDDLAPLKTQEQRKVEEQQQKLEKQQKAAGTDGTQGPSYKPVSPGAVPDDAQPTNGDTSLFGNASDAGIRESDQDGAAGPLPSRLPSTAKERREARKDPLGQPPASAKTRKASTANGVGGTPPSTPVTADATGDTLDTLRTSTVDADERLLDPLKPTRERPLEEAQRPVEENPYAAVGIRAGTFILRPSIEQGLTASSNANTSASGRSGVLSDTTLRLNAVSDWSRHSATIDAYGNFRKSLSGDDIEETRAAIDGALNLDLGEDLSALATLGYRRQPETASSPVVIEGTISQPIRQTYSGSAGVTKEFGRLRLGLTGRLDYDDYGAADLSNGRTLSQDDRDALLSTLVLRGGYELSPALTPFVEGEIGRRTYDDKVDSFGYERSSDRYGIRAGVEMNLDEKITGEISAGYIRETFDDERLRPISGPSIAAALAWSPERGTTVRLTAETTVEGATTAGESGSILQSLRLSTERQIRADLTGNAALGYGYRNYSGSDGRDNIFDAEVGATWWLNRYAGLTGRLRYERLDSNIDFRSYDATSVFAGLKLQR